MFLHLFSSSCSEKNNNNNNEIKGFMSRAMGWLFGCFRIKDSSVSHPEPVSSRNRNALSSLFLTDEESVRKAEGDDVRNPRPQGLDISELKAEAKFLKACGTLAETPAEIRKATGKWADTSAETLKLENKYVESPPAVKTSEEIVNTPSSCMTDGHNTRRISIGSAQTSDIQNVIKTTNVHDSETHSANSSVSSAVFAPSAQCKNKSVRFDLESDGSAFSSKGSSSDSASQQSNHSKPSPYPTPLKLNDEMQTPGTVFPAYNRIRSQYVYSALNPIENPSQSIESLNLNDEASLISTPISNLAMKNVSIEEYSKNEASLSSWLKPPSANKDVDKELYGSDSGKNIVFGRTPGDRPILGMVAAHWNDDEVSHIQPKWWDGNGIPNSTNKYKEDQKVSWHATPFEERLEKALSEETFISQRRPISGTLEFDESEESDTALSHLESSSGHSKSVVSF